MTQNIKEIFKSLKNIEPSRGLEGRILKAVAIENSRKVARNLMFARAGLAVSFGALVYTLFVFGRAFLESDFWNLAKLVFSDTGTIAVFWKDFAFSLLETFPVAYAISTLIPLLALVLFLNFYLKLNNYNHNRHYNTI